MNNIKILYFDRSKELMLIKQANESSVTFATTGLFKQRV